MKPKRLYEIVPNWCSIPIYSGLTLKLMNTAGFLQVTDVHCTFPNGLSNTQ